jgi:DNA ligase-1
MLASSADAVDDAMAKASPAGDEVAVDSKLDGIRIQVHKHAAQVHVYTRSLDEITDRVPEVVEAVEALPAHTLVLDGEAIALTPDGRARPFQETGARTASRLDVATLRAQVPLTSYFFDLLHVDGEDLVDAPGRERFARLAEVLPPALVVPRTITRDPAQAQALFDAVLSDGHEGVVVKSLDAPYDAGRRGAAWVKVKPRHTLDLVVLAVEWGSGRREGWLSNIHLGARNPDGTFTMLGKTFKGMTDEMLAWQTERFLALEESRTSYVVTVRPEQVVEVAFDGIQTSSRYPAGMALRFARVLRYRDDKGPDEADTLDTVRAFLG